jgi:heat-inducible transcriptional repressor
MDEHSIVMVVVTDSRVVKNRVIYMENAPDEPALAELSNLFNEHLRNVTLAEIDVGLEQIIEKASCDEDMVRSVMNAVVDVVQAEDDIQIYTSGVKNILNFPEFSDTGKAMAMFQALEEKDMLITLLGNTNTEKIQVFIGAENQMAFLEDCSVIKANYRVGERNFGSIGIIGPKRMNYSQAVSVLSGILKHINAVIKALSGGN